MIALDDCGWPIEEKKTSDFPNFIKERAVVGSQQHENHSPEHPAAVFPDLVLNHPGIVKAGGN